MMRAIQLAVACVAMLVATAGQVQAFIIDMEGIAPSGSITFENNANRTFGDFNVFVRHGHYWDSNEANVGSTRPDNGTDFLLNDSGGGIDISKLSGELSAFNPSTLQNGPQVLGETTTFKQLVSFRAAGP